MTKARRSIKETVEQGINNLEELQEALLTAIELEFSTIPPYLCAQWSINSSSDPSKVATLIQNVVVQEMLHFGLACNVYTATGGSLAGKIATSAFVPTYPTNGLPGGVHPGLVVSLSPLSTQSIETFMSIEYPEGGPVVPAPATPPTPQPPVPPTIGAFYETIAAAFPVVFPSGFPSTPTNQVVTTVGSDRLFPVNTVADALNAISEITTQGEGTSASPEEGTFDPTELAHFYAFAQVYYGQSIIPAGSGFQYGAPAVTMPAVYPFSSQSGSSATQVLFIDTFSLMLWQLEQSWTTSGANISNAVNTMFRLKNVGTTLIQSGVAPQFTFVKVPQ